MDGDDIHEGEGGDDKEHAPSQREEEDHTDEKAESKGDELLLSPGKNDRQLLDGKGEELEDSSIAQASIESSVESSLLTRVEKNEVTLKDIVDEDHMMAMPKSEKDSRNGRNGRDTNSITDDSLLEEERQVYTVNSEGDSVIFVMGDPDSGLGAAEDDPRFLHSKEILTTADNLINFSLFCGYANLRMDQTPEDKTFAYEFKTDDEYQDDDEWLTHSFFLHVTKERVDSIREATSKVFDPVLDSLDSKPLNSLKLVYEAINLRSNDTRTTVRCV